MTSEQHTERRVTRLENDVVAIYDMLGAIQRTQADHGNRLAGIDTRLDSTDTRLTGIDRRLDGTDTRLTGIDGRLDGIDGRLDGIDGRLDGIDGRLGRMDGRFDGIEATLVEVLRRLPEPS
jgi:archaellum component FlaC